MRAVRSWRSIRGAPTPPLILVTCLLAAWLGFVPGLANGPGLAVALLLALFLFNTNLLLSLAVLVPAKLVAIPALPLSFAAGRVLLDGPTEPIFRVLVNAPVLAYFGFEHYATAGGLVTGLAFGLAAGWLSLRGLASLRGFPEGTGRRHVALSALFLGDRPRSDLERRVGNPVRLAGVALTVLVVGVLWVGRSFLTEPILTGAMRSGLEQANGATVDLQSVELDLGEGRLIVRGLAMADPNALGTDLFRALTIEADVSTADLLRRRFAIDRIVISDATNGEAREQPGVRVGEPATPAPPEEREGEKTLEDYVEDVEVWRDRLAQARRWLEELGGEEETVDRDPEERARGFGYASVVAEHLIDSAPTFLVREISIEGLISVGLEGEVIDIQARNLSSHPRLVAANPEISVSSKSDRLRLDLGVRASDASPEPGGLSFRFSGLPVDAIASGLKVGGERPIEGGTFDVSLDGGWAEGRVGWLDLPLSVTLHDTKLTLPGKGSAKVSELAIPISLRGPLDAPRIRIDEGELADALARAGADELAGRVQAVIDEQVGELEGEAAELLEGKLKKGAGGLLDKLKKD